MNGKKLIKKMWIPVAAAFVIGVLGLSFYEPYIDKGFKEYQEESKVYLKKFIEEEQGYLKEISKKITNVKIDQVLFNELESEYVVQQQIKNKNKKYLWFEDKDKNFVFGVPAKPFIILNEGFDSYKDNILADKHFRSRTDFLAKLIHTHNKIDFSEWANTQPGQRNYYNWRYFVEGRYNTSPSTVLQQAVFDENKNFIGTLYLKIRNVENEKYYWGKWTYANSTFYDDILPIFIILTVISSLFIWFLMPTWVYIDAQQRDVQNPLTWSILTLISLFFGLVIYLITRPSTIKSMNCPHCDNELNGTRGYCPHCGYDLTSSYCQQCEYPIKPGWKFCPSCRTEIKSNIPDPSELPIKSDAADS